LSAAEFKGVLSNPTTIDAQYLYFQFIFDTRNLLAASLAKTNKTHRGNGFFTDNLPFLRNPRRAKRPKIELTRPFTTGMNAWAATFLLRITQ
jgi:hypothetical protein